MGSCEFLTYQEGLDPEAAFHAAVEESGYQYGHHGYTGKIAEKGFDGWQLHPSEPLTIEEARKLGWELLNRADFDGPDDLVLEKYGPALAIPVKGHERTVTVEFAAEPGKWWATTEEAWDCHIVLPAGHKRVGQANGSYTPDGRGRVKSGKLSATVVGGGEQTGWLFVGRAKS